jgi:Flp pilus assembly protein TadD
MARNRVLVDQGTLARYTLRHYPESFNARMDLGVAIYIDGDPEEAIRIYRENLSLLPDHPQTLENMATALAKVGRFD